MVKISFLRDIIYFTYFSSMAQMFHTCLPLRTTFPTERNTSIHCFLVLKTQSLTLGGVVLMYMGCVYDREEDIFLPV